MTDIATLGLRVESRQLAQGAQALDRLGDQAAATERQTTRATTQMTRGFTASGAAAAGMSRSFALGGNNTRMLAMQLSQVAQQAAAGGGLLRSLAIQLPDIGLAFGTIGIAAGVAAGAILPLLGNLFNFSQDARTATERVDDLASAFDNLKQAQDLASSTTDVLIERYGAVNDQILRLVRNLETAALSSFRAATQEAIAGFEEMDGAIGGALESLRRIEDFNVQSSDPYGALIVQGLIAEFSELPDAVGQAAVAVQNFATSSQEGLEVQRDRALDAAEALRALNDNKYDPAIAAILGFADTASQALARIRSEAGATAGSLSSLGMTRGSLFSDLIGDDGQIRPANELLFGGMEGDLPRARSRSGGGGGGGSGAREVTAEMRAADQVIRQAQEAAVQFSDVQGVLNERLASGAISLDTYNAALEQARERYAQVGDAAQFWDQQSQTLKDGILDAIVAGDSLSDTFEQLARSIARAALEAALFGTGPLAGSGSIFGGLFGSVFPGRASGGPVTAGQPYMVGERGKELFVPNQSGRIMPNNQLGGAQNITITLEVAPSGDFDARVAGTSERVAVNVVQANNRRIPSLMADAQRRGG